jgi:hypothetical protein
VANSVTHHQAWGLGAYSLFLEDPDITIERAFEVPDTANVRFTNMVNVSLGGLGIINRVINNTGGPTSAATGGITYLTSYP